MMPVYPGAPWLPKFKGSGDELKYSDWKEQISGLLGTQEMTEQKKVAIVLGALSGEAKREVGVLNDGEKDQVRKIFNYLDLLYGDNAPIPVLWTKFFSCKQDAGETVSGFILRLRELYCRLRRHDPDAAPSDGALRDQLLLGLQGGPLVHTLKVFVRRHPDEDFEGVRKEAMLLEAEYMSPQHPEVMCYAVTNPPVTNSAEAAWRESLKREILEDVKLQVKGLTHELIGGIRPLLQAVRNPGTPLRWPDEGLRQPVAHGNGRDDAGRPICRNCRRAGHIARFCRAESNQS